MSTSNSPLKPSLIIPDLLTHIPDITPDSILSRTIYKDEQLKVILFAFAAGQELSEHTSTHAAALHFLQGTADVTLGEERIAAAAGTWVHMPPQLPHSILATTPVIMLLLMFPQPSKLVTIPSG